VADPVGWALEVLGFEREVEPPQQAAVRRGFREALRAAHPDLGAAETEAADRIAELSEARRILLAQ
jgi:curved DNA-binding protein CbpA